MWTGRFKKQYRNLDPNTQQGGVEAIREIVSSVNPASLGTYKPNMGVFAYEIGRKYRIIYSIQYRDGIVDLLWACDRMSATARSKESQQTSIHKCSVLADWPSTCSPARTPTRSRRSTHGCQAGSILQGTTEVDSRPRKNPVRRAESRAAKRT